jgi:hypothetical protein
MNPDDFLSTPTAPDEKVKIDQAKKAFIELYLQTKGIDKPYRQLNTVQKIKKILAPISVHIFLIKLLFSKAHSQK